MIMIFFFLKKIFIKNEVIKILHLVSGCKVEILFNSIHKKFLEFNQVFIFLKFAIYFSIL